MAERKPRQAPPPEAENPEVTIGANQPPETIDAGEVDASIPDPGPAANQAPQAPDKEFGKLSDDDRAALFLTHLDTARKDAQALEAAMEVVRGIRKKRNRNRNLARTDGLILDELDKILADETRTRAELEDDARTRHFMRTVAGLPTGEVQPDLFAAGADKDSPNTITEARCLADGYHAGLAGEDATPPDYIPPEHHQGWLKEHERGQIALGKAWEVRQAIEQGRQA